MWCWDRRRVSGADDGEGDAGSPLTGQVAAINRLGAARVQNRFPSVVVVAIVANVAVVDRVIGITGELIRRAHRRGVLLVAMSAGSHDYQDNSDDQQDNADNQDANVASLVAAHIRFRSTLASTLRHLVLTRR